MKTLLIALTFAFALLAPTLAKAQTQTQTQIGDEVIVAARDALRRKDRPRLAELRNTTVNARHPLAGWVAYWELGNRLSEAQVDEVEAFYTRWSGSYVEDRLRNDWLLELGRRRDWPAFARDMPRFRMNDDREVTCYSLLAQYMSGQDVREAARAAWLAQRELDDGCNLLAGTLFEAGQFKADDVWRGLRQAAELGRPRVARSAAAWLGAPIAQAVGELFDNPARYLMRKPANPDLALLALMRMAAADPEAAATQFDSALQKSLAGNRAAWAWAQIGKQAALKQQPEAPEHYRRALRALPRDSDLDWSDDMLAWQVRAALRAPAGEPGRWSLIQRGIDAMSGNEQKEATWVFWKARAMLALAPPGAAGDAERAAARVMLGDIAGQLNFYGKLATEELGGSIIVPPAPAPLAAAERDGARNNPGFSRALQLIAMGLRNEGVREWNYTLRGLGDRELLAAAALACEREVWDRCINTSDRTHGEIDMTQRFPTPFRKEVLARARETGLDPAYIYGLIRQESRFVMDARSGAGASGLMQLMPATAKWTAKKIGLDFRPEMLADRDVNLRLGASYLKLVLDDFGGSLALAAAAYNAGPGRPRRWRDGGVFEPAAWAESIPFNETRDYVKKVLSNTVYYGALLTGQVTSLKARLGTAIGPRDPASPGGERDIP
jgi:soluble lytic murein transglycosylase